MFTQIRATAVQANNANITAMTVAAFSKLCYSSGYTQFGMNLAPKNSGAPNIYWTNGTDNVLVNISKPVAESLKAGKITKQELLGLQIIDGQNAKGEPRYYLAHEGRELFDANAVTVAAEKIRAEMKKSVNITDISSLVTI